MSDDPIRELTYEPVPASDDVARLQQRVQALEQRVQALEAEARAQHEAAQALGRVYVDDRSPHQHTMAERRQSER